MLVVFTAMALALLFAYFGLRKVAKILIVACLLLSVKQFLQDIYSPEDGFRMPWIQVKVLNQFQLQQSDFDSSDRVIYGDIA